MCEPPGFLIADRRDADKFIDNNIPKTDKGCQAATKIVGERRRAVS
jgi:hypothetical protein